MVVVKAGTRAMARTTAEGSVSSKSGLMGQLYAEVAALSRYVGFICTSIICIATIIVVDTETLLTLWDFVWSPPFSYMSTWRREAFISCFTRYNNYSFSLLGYPNHTHL